MYHGRDNDSKFDQLVQLVMEGGENVIPRILSVLYNEAMLAERENHLNAGLYERSDTRDGYANGFKPRMLQTASGKLELKIPQVRDSSRPFYPQCLERGTRIDRALNITAAEMYVAGVSTRKVEQVFKALGIEHFSSEQVSKAARLLDDELEKWRQRKLGHVKVLFADATYQKVRNEGVVTDVATFVVTGIDDSGHRSILVVDSAISESEVHWRNVFQNLVDRGIYGVEWIVSDAHSGLAAARKAVFPGAKWQRCQFHLQQDAQKYVVRQSLKGEVASGIRAIFNAPSLDEARRLLDLKVKEYEKEQPKLAAWMESNLPEGFTVFLLPERMRRKLRTNNLDERLNRSIKARTRIISVFPNQESQIRLVSAICMEISDEWEAGAVYLDMSEL